MAGITFDWLNWCGKPHSYRPLMTGHISFGDAVVSFSAGSKAICRTPGAPSTLQVSRPLVVGS
jgi:hypothetical protein